MRKIAKYDLNEDVIVLKLPPDALLTVENINKVGKAVFDVLKNLDHPVYMLTDWSDAYFPGDWVLMEQLCKETNFLYKAGLLGIIRFGVNEPANRLALKTHAILCGRNPNVHQSREEALKTLHNLQDNVLERVSA
jgi:hypothetical protein